MELIRDILLKLGSSENFEPNMEGYPDELVRYNMAHTIEGGLAEGTLDKSVSNLSRASPDVFLRKWSGHKFLDNVRKESV